MPLIYQQSITGTAIDAAVKAKTSTLSGASASGAGVITWQTVLQLLYTDFDTTLATSLMTYMQTTIATFPPGIPVPFSGVILPMTNLTPMSSASGSTLDGTIKAQTSTMTGSAGAGAGVIVWSEFCGQIGTDILNMIPAAVCLACAAAVPLVPPGFAAPPMIGSLAPAPPIYVGLVSAILTGLMTPFCTGLIRALGPQIDAAVKGATSTMSGASASGAGAIVWDTALGILIPAITLELSKDIALFFTQSVGIWMTTPVPGNPLILGVPTPGGAPAPATLLLV